MSLNSSYPQFISFEDIQDDDERYLKSILYELSEDLVELPWNVDEEKSNWLYEEELECQPEEVAVPSGVHIPPTAVHQVLSGCPPPAQSLIGVPVFVTPDNLPRPPGSALPTSHPAAVRPPFRVPPGIRTIPPPPYGTSMKPQRIDNRNCQPTPFNTAEKHSRRKKNDYYESDPIPTPECVPAYPPEHMLLPTTIPQGMPPPGMISYHAIPQTSVTIAHPFHQYAPAPPFYSFNPQYTTAAPALFAAVYPNTIHQPPYVYQAADSHEIPREDLEDETVISIHEDCEEEEEISESVRYDSKEYSDRTEVSVYENSNGVYANGESNNENEEVYNGQNFDNCTNSYEMYYDEQCVNNTDHSPNLETAELNFEPVLQNSTTPEVVENANVCLPQEEQTKTQSESENKETVEVSAVQNKVQSPAAEQPKSWSSLFKGKTPKSNNVSARSSEVPSTSTLLLTNNVNTVLPEKVEPSSNIHGSLVNVTDSKLGEILLNAKLNHRPAPIQPRGLINRGNWCYINATLQALMACPPFYNLLKNLPSVGGLKSGRSTTPVIDSMVEFVHEFKELSPSVRCNKDTGKPVPRRKEDIDIGSSFEPQYVYKMLECIKLDSFKGRQEDAEEFLTCLLNSLHEEMVALINMNVKTKNGNIATNGDVGGHGNESDEEEWVVMGPNKKGCITRSANIGKSPVSDIFEGQMRSDLRRPGETPSCILQSFFSLQLDIQCEKVSSVTDALESLVSKEAIQGYTCSKTNREVEASKKITLEELPVVLILHLKRFVYDKNGGCQKLNKKVTFPVELELSKDLLSPAVKTKYNPPAKRTYALFAVVYHDGAEAAKGHYITDVYHSALGTWLRTDDNNIHPISENLLSKHHNNRVPYLLYYRRCDTIHI